MLNVERLGVVLRPREGFAKFNAGMIRIGEKVQMLYRWAEGIFDEKGNLTGYRQDYIARAELDLDGRLLKDYDSPFIAPYDEYNSAGCQDPRIVEFEGEYYIFYTSYNLQYARVGISRTRDFNTVTHLGTVPCNDWDKDAFILPERINGKIVFIHRIEPAIQIDCFDSFEDMFDKNYWMNYGNKYHENMVIKGEYPWESRKVGGSVPPIKTELGWLFIYHGVADDREPFCYRAGVAVLDLNNPSKVVSRLPYPFLEPVMDYEVKGDVNNVVFPQGAYMNDGWLYISYGAADKYVAMARVRYDELMDELKRYMVY